MKEPDNQQRYYEVLRNLNELLVLLRGNNIMQRELLATQRADHETKHWHS